MAKKKGKTKKQKTKLSPSRYMQEKARTLPLGKCYIAPPHWQEAGIGHVIVTRLRRDGNFVMAIFLVDTFCLGVKDASFYDDISPESVKDCLYTFGREIGIEEISYDEAHNIIYGAIEYAREGGVEPCKCFMPAGYILEEDTDDIPLIEYEFGKDGKHFLICHDSKDLWYYDILKKNLGDNFDYIVSINEKKHEDDDIFEEDNEVDEDEDFELTEKDLLKALKNIQKIKAESDRYPKEVYSYQYPEYPGTLNVKHQFIADELLSKDNYTGLSRGAIDRILALPKEEAARDLSNVILYEIGRTYRSINDKSIADPDNSAIMHSLILLAQLGSDKGLGAVIELLCQNDDFIEYHLGDFSSELLPRALYACGNNHVDVIEDLLNRRGLDTYIRPIASGALVMIVINHPERRAEILEVYRRLLTSMVTRLPKQDGCDGCSAGFIIFDLMELDAKELIPEIKALYDTDCVDVTIAGKCKTVVRDLKKGCQPVHPEVYMIPDVYEQYEEYREIMTRQD